MRQLRKEIKENESLQVRILRNLCMDQKGKGERKGRMICRAGLFRNTWKFVKWTEKGHDCNAAKCDSCCKSVKITYASKP